MYAVVLAGGEAMGELAHEAQCKALININGKPMVSYVLKALSQSSYITHTIVVGNSQLPQLIEQQNTIFLPEKKDVIENIFLGLEHTCGNKPVLVVTGDIPMLSAEAVNHFIEAAFAHEAQVYYPIVSKIDTVMKYPDVKRTYISVCEGVFTGGNLFLIAPQAINQLGSILHQINNKRKNPFSLFRMMGMKFSFRMLLGRLSLTEIEDRVSEVTNVKVKAIISPHACVGTDIDKMSDLFVARKAVTVSGQENSV